MSVMVTELYEALRSAGVNDQAAKAAAGAVLAAEARTDLVTKADLAELKADLIKWNVGTLIALTAIYGGLVTFLKVFRP
jgi:hypothetical protein